MDYLFLTKTGLFRGADETGIEAMLACLGASTKTFQKDEIIFHAGDTVASVGMVLSGGVNIENDDIWGNRSILGHVGPGAVFGETYACIPGEPLMVNATASEKTSVLFLNMTRVMQTCPTACPQHSRLVANLLRLSAQKNLSLSRRILHTSSKSIRGRLLSYFTEQVRQNGSYRFTIPFNRQQLADLFKRRPQRNEQRAFQDA